MVTIKLSAGTYEYDPNRPLGAPGGFGQVFLGQTPSGDPIAVKRLHLSAAGAAHREMSIADELKSRKLEYVVPFIDSGEDADTGAYFLVMPRAEKNLNGHIEQTGKMSSTAASHCMLDVVQGLIEVGDLVHRDLKPDNILWHDGKWKIADFGIARFVSEATAANTLKDFLSRDYAAPEQWRLERATHATDVYALGCIGFFLLSSIPPYKNSHDFSRDHQLSPLPSFPCEDSRLSSLITLMTRKGPQTRPSLQRVLSQLQEIKDKPPESSSSGGGMLANAAAFAAQQEAILHANEHSAQREAAQRDKLAKEALAILAENCERLWGKVHRNAPNAVRKNDPRQFACSVGAGSLNIKMSHTSAVPIGAFPQSKWDVVAMAEAQVGQSGSSYVWSASLWYMRASPDQDYRWQEVSYCLSPFSRQEASHWGAFSSPAKPAPFACREFGDADLAASNIMHTVVKAFGPETIDDESENAFHDRWMWLLSCATTGRLRAPSALPITSWPPQM